jgi:hypothetical protein
VAKLADAPDLGLRNRRFRNIAFRFKAPLVYEGKSVVFREVLQFANGEQKGSHSSTNSSTTAQNAGATQIGEKAEREKAELLVERGALTVPQLF